MSYSAKQHSDGRWGIYYGQELLATVGCKETCDYLMCCLNKQKQKKSQLVGTRNRRKTQAVVP